MIFELGIIRIKLSFSFIAIIILMILLCEEKVVVLSLISSVIHESGHLFFLLIFKEKAVRIKFSAFGMKIERVNICRLSYFKEIVIALGGIVFNAFTALISLFIYSISADVQYFMFFIVNILIIAVNAVPIGMLDMGRAVEYALLSFFSDEKAERILDKISYLCVILFLIFTVIYLLFIGNNISLIAVTVYMVSATILKKRS